MTTQAETVEAPKGDDGKAVKVPGTGSGLLDFGVTVIMTAILSWLAGIALNKGFGVHVPVVAGAILLVAGLSVVKMAAAEVAQVWHAARVEADITLMSAALAVQESAQAASFLDMAGKIRDTSEKVTGGYL